MPRIAAWGLRLPFLVSGALLVVLVAGCASAVSGPVSPDELEAEAQGIDKSLMCPVCPSETIDQSQTEIANQMRVMVRESLARGESRDEILQFFVDRYGQEILAAPPKSGFNLLVWVIPPLAMLLGIGILVMAVRGMRQNHSRNATEETPLNPADLEPYLSAVDREIQRLNVDVAGRGTGSDEGNPPSAQARGGRSG